METYQKNPNLKKAYQNIDWTEENIKELSESNITKGILNKVWKTLD